MLFKKPVLIINIYIFSFHQDKQKSKEGKKIAHQFVIYNGSLVVCDVCQKPFNKKQVLKCESMYLLFIRYVVFPMHICVVGDQFTYKRMVVSSNVGKSPTLLLATLFSEMFLDAKFCFSIIEMLSFLYCRLSSCGAWQCL